MESQASLLFRALFEIASLLAIAMRITRHRPKHIDQTQNPYFVTGRTYFGLPYFDTDEKKEVALFDPAQRGRKASSSEARTVLLSALNLACEKYRLALDAWVILDNHYHLLFRPPGCTWEMEIADKSAISRRSSDFSRSSGRSSELARASGRSSDFSRSSGRSSELARDQIAPLGAIEDFRIGKVVGTIHGKSSSLLKEIADKSASTIEIAGKPATSHTLRNSTFTCDNETAGKPANPERNSTFKCDKRIADKSAISERKADKSATSYAAWWSVKYWEEIKHRNIALYGERSQLAEEKRAKEFQRLLKEGTPKELANFVKKIDRVWYQYTDHVIRNEGDYFRHLNYIHQNPVKHGYVKDMAKYQFSSYNRYLKEKGKKWLADCFAQYPIVDFMPKGIGEK